MKEVSELLDLLKDCHSTIDALMARLIILDRTFFPSKSPFWPVVQRVAEVLRETGRIE